MASILSDILDPLTGASDAAAAQTQAAELSAGAITESTEAQIDFQTWLWGEQQELAQPFVDVGVGALPGLTEAISEPFTAEQMMEDPGYQFRLEEGLKGVEASGAAKGMQLSGRTLKGIGRFNEFGYYGAICRSRTISCGWSYGWQCNSGNATSRSSRSWHVF
jgi:hypothetical protein